MEIDRTGNLLGALAVAVNDRVASREPGRDGRAVPAAALVHLSHCRRPTIESLRGVLGLSHSAAVRLADRLEAGGLAVRTPDTQDGRAAALRLTERGERSAAQVLDARATALAQALRDLDAGERSALAAIAAKLLAALVGDAADLYRICRLCDFDACADCPVATAARR